MRMETAGHLIWPSLIEVFRENRSPFLIPHFYRWSWRIPKVTIAPSQEPPVIGRIPLPDI